MGTPAAPGQPERVAFVLIDGVGDVTIHQLGGRTPLQAASLPHLDAVAGAAVRRLLLRVLHAYNAMQRDLWSHLCWAADNVLD